MIEVRETAEFTAWFAALDDTRARARIDIRIRRIVLGNFGDVKPIGQGLSELRIDSGPGYRVYFVRRGAEIVVLLGGGDKHSQDRDIRRAKDIERSLP
jgi:putative addiction module killer protein